MNSRNKGKRYELELAAKLRQYGYDARRGQQYSGANGDPDVTGLPGIHIEAKRRQKIGNLYEWMAQSVHDARDGEIPTIFCRGDHSETMVVMRFDDWMLLYNNSDLPDGGNADAQQDS